MANGRLFIMVRKHNFHLNFQHAVLSALSESTYVALRKGYVLQQSDDLAYVLVYVYTLGWLFILGYW